MSNRTLTGKWGPIRRAQIDEVPPPSGRQYRIQASLRTGAQLYRRSSGMWGAYILMPPHPCKQPLACSHTEGAIIITVLDAREEEGITRQGRWIVTCSAHQPRTRYRHRGKAEAAARDGTFCAECRKIVLMCGPCPICTRKHRGCAICLPHLNRYKPDERDSDRGSPLCGESDLALGDAGGGDGLPLLQG